MSKLIRFIKKHIFLFIVFFIITMSSFITLNNIFVSSENLNSFNKRYSEYAVDLSINDGFDAIDLNSFLSFFYDKDESFLATGLGKSFDNQFSTAGLLKGENCKIKFLFIDGAEISYDEYINKENVAMIKESVFNALQNSGEIISIDEEIYFEIYGALYKIKGIFSDDNSSDLADIYINITSLTNNTNFSSELQDYYFRYDNNQNTSQVLKELSKSFNKVSFSISAIKKGQEAFVSAMEINKIYIISSILLILVSVLTVINISLYWIESQKKEFGIRKLVGGNNLDLIIDLIIKYISIAISAMFLGGVVYEISKYSNVFTIFINNTTTLISDIYSFIILTIIIFIIIVLVSIKPIITICKLQINEIIRGAD